MKINPEIKEKIQSLTSQENPESLLEIVTVGIFSGCLQNANTSAFLELARLLLNNIRFSSSTTTSYSTAMEIFRLLPNLTMHELNKKNISDDWHSSALAQSSDWIIGHGFPEQTVSLINEVMSPFEIALTAQVGIGPIKSTEIVEALFTMHSLNVQNHSTQLQDEDNFIKHLIENKISIASDYQDLSNLGLTISNREWQSFKALFCMPTQNLEHLSYKEMKGFPIFCFTNDKLLIWNFSHSLNCIWDYFEEKLKHENKFNKRRCAWLENRTEASFKSLFGNANVFATVHYPNPEKTSGTAELDLLIRWGKILICIEVKAGQIDWSSLTTNMNSAKDKQSNRKTIRKHLIKVIREAWRQGERAEKYFAEEDNPTFTTKGGKNKNSFTIEKPLKIILLAISLKPLHSLICDTTPLKEFEVIRENDYPVLSNIFDLEIILANCLGKPDTFLAYLIEKSSLVCSPSIIHTTDELDLFDSWNLGYFDHNNHKRSHFTVIGDFQNGQSQNQLSKLLPPQGIQEILIHLRDDIDPSSHLIATELTRLGLPAFIELDEKLKDLKNSNLKGDQIRVISFMQEDTLFIAVCVDNMPLNSMENCLIQNALDKLNSANAKKAIGIAVSQNNPFQPQKTVYIEI
jgi:hypothetical protein